MITLESQKLYPPKFSRSIYQLVKFLGIEVNEDQVADHEASLRRLMSKDQIIIQASPDAYQPPYQSHSLEPMRPSRYEPTDTGLAGQLVNPDSQTSPKRGRKKDKLRKSVPSAGNRQLSKSPPKQQSPRRRDVSPRKQDDNRLKSPRLSDVFNEVVKEMPGESHRTDEHQLGQLDYNSDELGSKTLQAYQSIHTIQEDEFN